MFLFFVFFRFLTTVCQKERWSFCTPLLGCDALFDIYTFLEINICVYFLMLFLFNKCETHCFYSVLLYYLQSNIKYIYIFLLEICLCYVFIIFYIEGKNLKIQIVLWAKTDNQINKRLDWRFCFCIFPAGGAPGATDPTDHRQSYPPNFHTCHYHAIPQFH